MELEINLTPALGIVMYQTAKLRPGCSAFLMGTHVTLPSCEQQTHLERIRKMNHISAGLILMPVRSGFPWCQRGRTDKASRANLRFISLNGLNNSCDQHHSPPLRITFGYVLPNGTPC